MPYKFRETAQRAARNRYLRKKEERLAKAKLYYQTHSSMAAAQKGKCAICGKHSDELLVVDHDHVTGIVRGLLCRQCNILLGAAYDDMDILLSAVEYLGAPKP